VNGNQSEAKVWKAIRTGLEEAGIKPASN